jgi:polysaccharide pyruvyl transferase WcaK-like protein
MNSTGSPLATHADVWVGDGAAAPSPATNSIAAPDLPSALGRLPHVRTLSMRLRGPDAGAECARLVQRVTETLPNLEAIAISVDAADSSHDVAGVIEACELCRASGRRFSADFILDGDADAFAALGGRPTSLRTVLGCSKVLLDRGVPVRWLLPLIPSLIYRLEALCSLAQDERIDPMVVPAHWVDAGNDERDTDLTPDDRLFAFDFVTYRLLDEERAQLSPDRLALYLALQAALGSAGPNAPHPVHRLPMLRRAATGAADGWVLQELTRSGVAIYPIDGARTQALENGGRRLNKTVAHAMDACGVLHEGVRGLLQWMGAKAAHRTGARRESDGARRLPTILMIGAYGGDHIGDTAILGGVLRRMHQRHGTTRAVLMSQRPAHTDHLVRMLDTPIAVRVEEYLLPNVRAVLPEVDAVVFAGGPLTDIPKQLVKHLYTVSLARRRQTPFFVEGVGAGPFFRRVSAWTARRLVLMADRVVVRTSTDGAAPLVRDLDPQVGRDPAFDYLETRGVELTRCPEQDSRWIERLAHDTAGRRTVGINIRPIRFEYAPGASAGQRLTHTRSIEHRFSERMAEALRRMHHASPTPPCFIFFPMNAIQFGMSDLRSAYRIGRLLGDAVDFRVWEGDASLDGVVGLLRKVDVAVTMRFHATIFALSQHRRVVGIDYRIGKSDKVAALLNDAGRSDDCVRIDELTSEWLVERLVGVQMTNVPAFRECVEQR